MKTDPLKVAPLRNLLLWFAGSALLIAGASTLLSCGLSSRGGNRNGESPLKLIVLHGGEDSSYPERSPHTAQSGGGVQTPVTVAGQNILVFPKVVFLPDPDLKQAPLFLAWGEMVDEAKIVEAHFEVKVQDPNNQEIGNAVRNTASYDAQVGRWFVPFERILPVEFYDADPADTYSVHLDLLFKDGTKARYEARLHLRGPRAKVRSSIQEVVLKKSELGYPVQKRSIQNLSRRYQYLWVRVLQSRSVETRTIIQSPEWRSGGAHDAPSGPFQRRWLSRGKASIRLLEVQADLAAPSLVDVSSSDWDRLLVAPNQTVTLTWYAQPNVDSTVCHLPSPQHFEFGWTRTPPTRCGCSRGECGCNEPSTQHHRAGFDAPFEIFGMDLRAEYAIDLRMADTFMKKDQATAEVISEEAAPRVLTLDSRQLQQKVTTHFGEKVDSQLPDFECQGIF